MLRGGIGLIACAGVLATAGCGGDAHGPTLRIAGNAAGLGASIPSVRANDPVVLQMPGLCTTGGPISIVSMEADASTGGMHVVDWVNRPRFEGDNRSLQDAALADDGRLLRNDGFGHHAVTERCDQSRRFVEVEASLATTSARGSMRGLAVTYRSGGGQRTLRVPYTITFCAARTCPAPTA